LFRPIRARATQRPPVERWEVVMRSQPRLGAVNAALVSLYFAPVWGLESLRVMTSPFSGFEDRAHATAASYFRAMFDFGLDGLVRTSMGLAGLKFVIAAGFVAYLIEFARGLAVGREPNRETLDIVLLLASLVVMLWAWPALMSRDPALIRLEATQFLLLSGAMILLVIERQADESADERAEVIAGSAVLHGPRERELAAPLAARAA
jgi:hypothetical protein